jgi:hypothetical protein
MRERHIGCSIKPHRRFPISHSPSVILDLVDQALAADEPVSPELASQFIALFPSSVQISLMGRALDIASSYPKENSPCPVTALVLID